MIDIKEKHKCCGCTACANICPKNAITMKIDDKGFKYPDIDQSKCINCGLCKKTCPVLNTKQNDSRNNCYVGYSKNIDDKIESSSGGIFSIIADYVLDNNGIVVGAAFENNKLIHVAITKKEELYKLKGSKYLQSDLVNIFKYVKENVKNKLILFVGTPCQVAGLKAFINNDEKNLICVDLFCHGVPSPKLYEKYVNELEKENGKLLNYNFRDKKTGWDTYSNTMVYESGKKLSELSSKNNYMRLFLCDVALRDSCFNCNFKLGNKYSDITLGDFWGVKNYYPDMYNKEGVSAIIVNTSKGEEIFNNIKDILNYKTCNINEIINGNPSLVKSGNVPKKREEFWKDFDKLSIKDLTKKYTTKSSFIRRCLSKIKRIIKNCFLDNIHKNVRD